MKELAAQGVAEPDDGSNGQWRNETNTDITRSDGGTAVMPMSDGSAGGK